jgi:hypothetical protein
MFWTPAFPGVTFQMTFYETIKLEIPAKFLQGKNIFFLQWSMKVRNLGDPLPAAMNRVSRGSCRALPPS